MLAIVLAFVTPASASGTGPGIAGAQQCLEAPGPGNQRNSSCIDVKGSSTYVESVHGYLNSNSWPGYPVEICGLKVDVWGTLYGGQHWEKTHTNTGCHLGSAGAKWNVGLHFKPNTYLCARTTHDGQASQPNCIEIRS